MTELPSFKNAEQCILSILMNVPEMFDQCDELQPEHFTDDWMRRVFVEMRRQNSKGRYDLFSLYESLKDSCTLQDLHEVSSFLPGGRKVISVHVARLVEAHKSRQLYAIGTKLHALAFDTSPISERVDQAGAELLTLQETGDTSDWIDAHEAAIQHIDLIESREAGTNHGIPTSLTDLDELLDGGFQRGNLVVIGARPAMGKTALGMTVGLNIAKDYAVGFMSMEMPHSDVRDRQTAILGNVSISSIKRPKRGLEYDRVVDAIERAKTRKFFVSDKSGLNIIQLRSRARMLKRQKGLDVLIVDYIGLMSGTDSKVSRAYQIEEISRGLKTLAKELEIVVICLAQVNRGAAERGNQAPGLHDLRDSGAIEQDADVVMFIHRPIQAEPDLGSNWADYALLRLSKNRQGRTGDVHLFYVADQTRFGSWSGEVPSKSISNSSRKVVNL